MDNQEREKWLQEIIDAEPEDGAFAGEYEPGEGGEAEESDAADA